MENCRGREKREWKRTGAWVGGRWKRVAGDGNELLYHEITPVLLERKDTCVRVGGRRPRPTSVFLSQGRFSRSPRPRSPSDSTAGGGGTDRPNVHARAAFPPCCHFFWNILWHGAPQSLPCDRVCVPKVSSPLWNKSKRMCLGNTLCLCNFVAPQYAQTNPNQARCIKAPSTLAAPVTPVVFPSLVWSLSSLFTPKKKKKTHHLLYISMNKQRSSRLHLERASAGLPPRKILRENLRKQAPVCRRCNQKGLVGSTKPAFNFPSHNAALQCFDISHKTQLAFQIRALTFGWRQADWYLHNLDGLSVLRCPRPFVSNVHTHRDDYRLWVNFSHRWL